MELRIKEVLKEKKILFKDLALQLNVTDIALRASLKGNPTIATLKKIAVALNVPITELFEPETEFYGIIQYKGVTYKIDGFEAFKRLCMDVFNLDEDFKRKVEKE